MLCILHDEDNVKIQGYNKKIVKYSAEIAKLQQSELQNKKHLKFFGGKIEEYERNKNKVKFMRFLIEKLPLSLIVDKRTDIPEMDMLLKAFWL